MAKFEDVATLCAVVVATNAGRPRLRAVLGVVVDVPVKLVYRTA